GGGPARAKGLAPANSNPLGCREDRPAPARTSAISLFGFLRAEFIERPRILRRGGLGLGEIELGAIRQRNAGQRLASLLGPFDHLLDAWSALLVRLLLPRLLPPRPDVDAVRHPAPSERVHPLLGGRRGDGVGRPQSRKRTHDNEAREIDAERGRQFRAIGEFGHVTPPSTALHRSAPARRTNGGRSIHFAASTA